MITEAVALGPIEASVQWMIHDNLGARDAMIAQRLGRTSGSEFSQGVHRGSAQYRE